VKVSEHIQTRGSQLGGAPQQLWVPTPGQVHPMAVLLFGKRAPRRVDKRKFPRLGKAMRKLEELKEQIAPFAGRGGGELELELCEGENASISQQGSIYVGVELLEKKQGDDDFLVAVMGHEIGHRPWSWPGLDLSRLSKRQRQELAREEEAKADRFAGRILAELGADPESVCRYLAAAERFEAHPSAEYYPAEVRASQIRDAFRRRLRQLATPKVAAGFAPRRRELR